MIVKRRYQIVVELDVDTERFGPNEVPDDVVAIENYVTDELGGTIVEELCCVLPMPETVG